MKVYCKNEFIHRGTGVRHEPGDVVEIDDAKIQEALEADIISLDPVERETPADAGENPDKSWNVKRLKAFAAEHGIKLTSTKKDDILVEIQLALEADAGEDEETGEDE